MAGYDIIVVGASAGDMEALQGLVDLQNLSAATEIATLFLDRELRLTRYTPAVERIFNVISTDLHRPLAHITHTLRDDRLVVDAQEVLASLQPLAREVESTAGQWYLVQLRPYRTTDDHIAGVVITFVDITAHKQAEAALRELEENFRAMFDVSSVGQAQADAKTRRFLRVNAALCAMTGYTEAELLTMTVDELNHPDDRARDGQLYQRLSRGETDDYQAEKRYVRKDGSIVWVHVTGNVIRDPHGGALRTIAVIQDITERKRTEAALAEQARLLDLSNDAIIVRDVHNRIIYWNHGATELYGWTRDEAVGQDLHSFLRTEFEVPLAQLMTKLQQHDRMEGEVVQVTRDGRRITVACRWALDRDAEGRPGAILTTYNDITERKRAEAALRESEARYRTLFESIDQGFCIIEVLFDDHDTACDYRFLEVNPAFELQTGLAQAVGKRMRELAPQHEAHWFDIYGAVAVTGTPIRFEQRAEALHRWFDVYAFRVGEPSSHRVAILFADITERKRTEEALRASEERLQTALSIDTVGVIFFDFQGVIRDANPAFERMSGYTHADVQRGIVRWDQLTPPEFMAPSLQARDELITRGESTPYEKQYIRPDGSRWWGLFAGKRLSEDEGVEFVLDISERKRAEAALYASEERLRLVLESVQDYAIFTVDPAGRVTSWNEGSHQIKGYTSDEIVGQPMERFFTDEDVAAGKPAHALETALREGRAEDESWRVRKDGSRFWANEVMTPLYADDGTHLGFTTICRDLTARKQAEEAVARALVAEQAARTAAEAALQTREQFISIASHELRTPLTPLLGSADMLRQSLAQTPDGRQRKLVETIERQGKRLNTLVGSLLDVARLQRGQFALEPRPLDLAALATQIVDEFRLTVPAEGGHTLTLVRPDTAVPVLGDAERLEQVLHNLLSNAIKYSPDGGTVRVQVARQDGQGVLTVADEGIGIPAAEQEHLFEPFFRAGNIGQLTSGFGLGLYIVQEIVQRHGGRVEVESTEGQGTTFRVSLRLAEGAVISDQWSVVGDQ